MNAVFYISGKPHLLAVLDAEQNKLVTFDAHFMVVPENLLLRIPMASHESRNAAKRREPWVRAENWLKLKQNNYKTTAVGQNLQAQYFVLGTSINPNSKLRWTEGYQTKSTNFWHPQPYVKNMTQETWRPSGKLTQLTWFPPKSCHFRRVPPPCPRQRWIKGIALPDRHRLAPRPWQVGCSTSVISCRIFSDCCTESIYMNCLHKL